ncbi:MAG: MlaC/ttg2D family ABC transporter substrate-binding protein [Planctomycetota bacterium]|jgi:phospholipid transport system substrate-binding protein
MKKILNLLLFFLLLSQVAVAGGESEAEKILKTSVNNLFAVMSNNILSMDQKKIEVAEIANSVFDYSLIAKLTLGKKHWVQFNTKQRAEFTILFKELYQDTFIDKLDLYSDERVIFHSPVIKNKKNVKIPTVLISKGKKYSILFKMFKTRNGWKICDIVIEGVSQLRSHRSQYQNAINNRGIEGLLTKMREKKIENEKR